MNKTKLLSVLSTIFVLVGCVQASSKKTVILRLNVAGLTNIQTVGVRGDAQPLSWRYDKALTAIKKDTLYTTTFSLVTGYKFTEIKFTVNGEFELQEKGNRKIVFSSGDTTIYEAKFDVLQ